MSADIERWLATGRVRQQQFSPEDYQYLLEQGEDPSDPASLLHVGPSDAAARDYWRRKREEEAKLAKIKRRK